MCKHVLITLISITYNNSWPCRVITIPHRKDVQKALKDKDFGIEIKRMCDVEPSEQKR
jgi:hypothetical protein